MKVTYGTESPYQRGIMDSYYRRPFDPHKIVGGSLRSAELDGNEMQEYARGFDENESLGDYKEYN